MKIDRNKIHQKFGGRCSFCGEILQDSSGKFMQIDHLIPLRRNWWENSCMNPENETYENLYPSCPKCNNLKNSLSLESFRNTIKDTIRQLERSSTYQRAVRFGMIEIKEWDGLFYFERITAVQHTNKLIKD